MGSIQSGLVARREQMMDRVDRALDKAWPERKGEEYVREMEAAAKEFEEIAKAMRASGVEAVEESRAYRYLGSVLSDLAPASGKQMLSKSIDAYRKAEALLEGHGDALEQAKLDFNFGNTLRQLDPNDIEQLQEAERRFMAARKVFAVQATQQLTQVDEALSSTRNLLKIAPLANSVQRSLTDMTILGQQLSSNDPAALAAKMEEVRNRGGGAAGILADAERILSDLPDSVKKGKKYDELKEQMRKLAPLAAGIQGSTGTDDAKVLELLKSRLKTETEIGRVTPDRAKTLEDLLDNFSKTLMPAGDTLQSLMAQVQEIRAKSEAQFATWHYMSHGIERPPAGSRSAELVELCWALRLFLIEEINRSGKSPGESKILSDLNARAAN